MPIVRDGSNRVHGWRGDLATEALGSGELARWAAGLPVSLPARPVTVAPAASRFHHDAGLSRAPRRRRVFGPGDRRRSTVTIADRDARAQRVAAALARYDRQDPCRFELVADELGMKANAVAMVVKHLELRKARAAA